MDKKCLTILISILFLPILLQAQRKTTSVKGYTKKDGTYVRPHTRTYNSSNSSTYISSRSYSNDFSSNNEQDTIKSKLEAKLGISKIDKKIYDKPVLIKSTSNSNNTVQDAFYINVYVLRYNDTILDIIAEPRESIVFYPSFSFDKDKIPSDIVIDLVSNYDWSLKNDILSKKYYSFNTKDPKYLTRKKEKITIN